MKLYIGIDPGLDGAVAAIDEHGSIISLQDTPTLIVKKGAGTKRAYAETAMVTILEALDTQISKGNITVVGIENVHSMPGQGVTSMFSMGTGFGLWLGILAALRLRHVRVEPTKWKKAMGIPSGSAKDESIVRAVRLFPTAPLSRKKDHGRADALLLAEYLRTLRNPS